MERRNLKCNCYVRSQSEKTTLVPNVWHSRKDKAMETVKRSVVGVGGKRVLGRWNMKVLEPRSSFDDPVMVDVGSYILVKAHRLHNKKWTLCQVWALGDNDESVRFSKCITVGQDVDSRGRGWGSISEPCTFCSVSLEAQTTSRLNLY